MIIHEFQAKKLLSRFGIRVPPGDVAETPEKVRQIAEKIGSRVVLKAQVHAGGRGKSGGIRTAGNPDEAEDVSRRMLGMTLVTAQTGRAGKIIRKLLVEESLDIRRELYLGVTIDRTQEAVVVIASTDGGAEIEKTSIEKPEKIFRELIDPAAGFWEFQAKRIARKLDLNDELNRPAAGFIAGLYTLFMTLDASLVEINPFAVTDSGGLFALDAKMGFDDNALYRHPDILALRDPSEETPLEVEASKSGLNYVKLDGDIGCMVNGAGLAMATMDIIRTSGGAAANFLDVGGGVSEEAVFHAFRILVADKAVKAVLVNIFGGIVRCDKIAAGIVRAAQKTGFNIPLVARLEGTNVELGKKILEESGLAFSLAPDMKSAAEKAVSLAKQRL